MKFWPKKHAPWGKRPEPDNGDQKIQFGVSIL